LTGNLQLFAFLDPGEMALMIPLVAMFIPIVAILVKHQQRMTEIVHGSGGVENRAEVAQLRQEVYELKQMLHQQMIAMDSLMVPPAPVRREPTLEERLEQTR